MIFASSPPPLSSNELLCDQTITIHPDLAGCQEEKIQGEGQNFQMIRSWRISHSAKEL